MSSRLEIFNGAVARCGEGYVIRNPDETGNSATVEGECRRHYDRVRRRTIARLPWGFCRRTSSVSLISDEITGTWAYNYLQPRGCLRVIGVYANGGTYEQPIPYETSGWTDSDGQDQIIISTNELAPILRWIKDVDQANVFPEHFTEAVTWALCAEIAPVIADSPRYRQEALAFWQDALETAWPIEANQNWPAPVEAESTTARG